MFGRFSDVMQARVKTLWFKNLTLPTFLTTTNDDYMAANILLMGLVEKYFECSMGITCGLPSVTSARQAGGLGTSSCQIGSYERLWRRAYSLRRTTATYIEAFCVYLRSSRRPFDQSVPELDCVCTRAKCMWAATLPAYRLAWWLPLLELIGVTEI